MNREPLDGEIFKTDDGQYIRYNVQIGCYELLEGICVRQPQSTKSQSADHVGDENEAEISEDSSAEDTSSTDISSKRRLWDLTTTLLMLDECSTHKQQLADPKIKNTGVYKKISKKLLEHGYNFTPDQLKNRMKTLISKYKEIRDHNAGSGNSFMDWEYYDIMENYLGKTPNITPIASCSSLGNNIITAINERKNMNEKNKHKKCSDSARSHCSTVTPLQSSSKSNVTDNNSTQINEAPQKRAKRFRPSPRVELLEFLKEYKEDVKRRELERMKMMKEQHQETKEMVTELLSILRDSKEK